MLSVRQPWAHLIVSGIKDVENRDWGRSYRGPLLIHAGQARGIQERTKITRKLDEGYLRPDDVLQFGGIIGIVHLVDVVEDSESKWAIDGAVHWVLRRPRRVPFVRLKAMVGLLNQKWPLPPSGPRVTAACSFRAQDLALDGSDADDDVVAVATPSSTQVPIRERTTDEVMAAFREAARGGEMSRGEMLSCVAQGLGYSRRTSAMDVLLRGHLRAAIRRGILASDGDVLAPATRTIDDYDLGDLRGAVLSCACSTPITRDDLARAAAHRLGFRRRGARVADALKSAINSAIRRGLLDYHDDLVWRAR